LQFTSQYNIKVPESCDPRRVADERYSPGMSETEWKQNVRGGGRGCTADRRGRHCSARTPPADRRPPRRRRTVGIDRRGGGDAKHLVWLLEQRTLPQTCRPLPHCPHAVLTPPNLPIDQNGSTRHRRREYNLKLIFSLVRTLFSFRISVVSEPSTCPIIVIVTISYHRVYYRLYAFIRLIYFVFSAVKYYCAQRTERVLVLSTSDKVVVVSFLSLLYYYCNNVRGDRLDSSPPLWGSRWVRWRALFNLSSTANSDDWSF